MLDRLRRRVSFALAPGLAGELRGQRQAAALPHEQIEALQLAKLNALLAHWRGVDWYARLLAEHGVPAGPLESLAELARLPVVTKEFILRHGPRMAAAPGRPLRKNTSGSSGRVFTFYVPRAMLWRMAAATIAALEMIGCDFFADRRFILWHWLPREYGVRGRLIERIKRWALCTRCMHVFEFDDEQAAASPERIARFRPRFITAFAGVLYVLARAGLDNTASPFIRYAIGDAGRVAPSRCPCGRNGQAVEEVAGRVYEIITTPSGRVLPGQFWGHMCWMSPGVEQYQVVQTAPDRVQLRLVPDERYSEAVAEGFHQWLRRFVGDEIVLDVVTVDRIEPGPSGKRRFVIRLDPPLGGELAVEPAERREGVR